MIFRCIYQKHSIKNINLSISTGWHQCELTEYEIIRILASHKDNA